MRIRFIIFSLILCMHSPSLKAQGEAAVPFLLIGPSGYSSGLGGAQTALPTNDTFGFYYNPAQLGLFARSDNLSFQYQNVDWLPAFHFSDLYFTAHGVSTGHRIDGTPFAVGLGYMRGYLNLGKNVWTDEQGNYLGEHLSKEWYDALSIGLSFNWYFNLSLGFTYKSFVSDLMPSEVGSDSTQHSGRAEGAARDFGALLHIPLTELISVNMESVKDNSIIPVADLFLGMTLNNVGSEISYLIPSQKDPLPRQAKIGMAARLGLKYKTNHKVLTPLQLSWTTEANDILVNRQGNAFAYQSFPGDISIQKNVLNGTGNDRVINRHGFEFTIFEMFTITRGVFSGNGFETVKTSGFSISSRGVFKLLTWQSDDMWKSIIEHVDIRYTQSSFNAESYDHPLSGTFFQNLSINVYGF